MIRRGAAGWMLLVALMPALAGCAGTPSFLLPAGPIASDQRHLFFVVIALMMIVVLPVFLGLPWVLWRYRQGNDKSDYQPKWSFSKPLEFAIWGVPVLVVVALAWQVWTQTHKLDPYKRLEGRGDPIEVQAVGLDWKWLFIYPRQGIATVNRLVVPAGRPVHISLTSDTVMQSLMIPRLGGQIYAMAGMRTQLNLIADRPGRYLGENTQYNGKGFHLQKFDADAVTPAQFDRWIAQARAGRPALDAERYAQLAKQSVPDEPMVFGSVPPDLFAGIIDKYDEAAPKKAQFQEASSK
ncbi:COX aromatic rich motif-containing protein [Novosphingobium malaysiense]|uniref:Ubiquinol oxidase subunit 2 n=1 Tax=Novosphingobium malaysiense TaxID=1348853 RepID=A0A0B1ZNQ3_9SPHN|nr:COX aromatic rich motif-containing protein [Novosphingobium malaysiense]KHK90899.1 hypothetical protein LK12_08040 [Novosphingobium malaysiense]